MFRFGPKFTGRLLLTNSLQNNTRKYSTKSSLKYKLALLVGTGAVGVSAVTLAYAKYDKEFGEQVTAYLPFLKSLLEEEKIKSIVVEDSFMRKSLSSPLPVTNIKEKTISGKKESLVQESSEKHITDTPKEIAPKPIEPTVSSLNYEIAQHELKNEVKKSLEVKADNEKEHENEFRAQLKRLLYAFNEFYEEKRILYETESKRKQEIELKNHILQEKAAIADDYEKSFKKLKQMEYLLELRDQLDKQEKASKKLWVLSQTLSKILEHNRTLSKETKPIKIDEKIECIRQVINEHFANEVLIKTALDSLPENIVKNGVYSEEDLIRRFSKVEKICNQVALVDSNYTTLFGYVKSFAYSFVRPLLQLEVSLSMDPIKVKRISQQELDGVLEVDPKEWDTYDILQRVHHCIEHRNFDLALRYANLLRGEPRKVAQDWIRDTREYLEVKQALSLVQTKIEAINVHQLAFTH